MSRQIDETKPLSDEDRTFLMQNGQELRVARIDAATGVTDPAPGHLTGAEPSLSTGVAASALSNAPGVSPAQVAAALGDPAMFLGSFTDEQLQAELDRREDARDAAEDGDSSTEQSRASTEVVREDEDGVPDYEDWKADNLRAQLGVRELNKSGNKSELVARLREDDADSV